MKIRVFLKFAVGSFLFFLLLYGVRGAPRFQVSAGSNPGDCCGCHKDVDYLTWMCLSTNYACNGGCPVPTPTKYYHPTSPPLPTPTRVPGATNTPAPGSGGGTVAPGEPTPTPLIQCVTCSGTICLPDALGNNVCGPAQPCPDASCPTYCIPGGVGWGCGGGGNTIGAPSLQFNPDNQTDNDKFDVRFSSEYIINRTPSSSSGACNGFSNIQVGPDLSNMHDAGGCDNWAQGTGWKTCTASGGDDNRGATMSYKVNDVDQTWSFTGGQICAKATLSFRCPHPCSDDPSKTCWDGSADGKAESAPVCITWQKLGPQCIILNAPPPLGKQPGEPPSSGYAPLVVGDTYDFTVEAKSYDTTRNIRKVLITRSKDGANWVHMPDYYSTNAQTYTSPISEWTPTLSETGGNKWCVACNAYYNDDLSGANLDRCSGNPFNNNWTNWGHCSYTWSDHVCYDLVTPTPVAPTCTVGNLTPAPGGCYRSNPALSATYGGGADQGQINIYNTASSDWLSSNPFSYTNPYAAATGAYAWYALPRSTTGTCTTPDSADVPQSSYLIDVSAPTPPVTPAGSYNPATKKITFTWQAAHDDGCANCPGTTQSGNASSYWLQQWWFDEAGPDWETNGWVAPSSCTSPSYTNSLTCDNKWGRWAYLRVRQAKDNATYNGTTNYSGETMTYGGYQCPTPTLIPTIAITGTLRQKSGSSTCYSASSSNPFKNTSIVLNDTSDCVSSTCNYVSSSQSTYAYNCSISFDNRTGNCLTSPPSTSQTITLNSSVESYGAGSWVDPDTCPAAGTTSLNVTAGSTYAKNIQYDLTGDYWFKIKHGSFQSSNPVNNLIPPVVNSFGADDDGSKNLIVGSVEPGSATGVNIGLGASYSAPHNWGNSSSLLSSILTPQDILSNVQSRKEFSEIVTFEGMSDGVYLYNGNLVIADSGTFGKNYFNDRKILLVVNGNVSFNITGNFAPTNASVAIVSTGTMTFAPTIASADGLFIATTVDTGSSTQSLQINGNLIATTALTQGRQVSDTSKPSLFVFYKPSLILNLLPYLSVSKYEWRQLQ